VSLKLSYGTEGRQDTKRAEKSGVEGEHRVTRKTYNAALRATRQTFFAWLAATSLTHAAELPRTSERKPDLSGIWQVLAPVDRDLRAHAARADSPAHLGSVVGDEIPYQPWAAAQQKRNFEQRAKADPQNRCFMPGVPRANYTPLPFQIFQAREQTTILYEYAHSVRRIYTNGTPHPAGPIGWFLGDSRGHWEGDTLVVDVVHLNDETWLDHAGNFHSDELHVVERYTLIDKDHLQYEATLEDPKVFTRPWSIKVMLYRRVEPGIQLLDYECYIFDYEKYYPVSDE
jgi:hypothetical protein